MKGKKIDPKTLYNFVELIPNAFKRIYRIGWLAEQRIRLYSYTLNTLI
jgi:hypothetical protein